MSTQADGNSSKRALFDRTITLAATWVLLLCGLPVWWDLTSMEKHSFPSLSDEANQHHLLSIEKGFNHAASLISFAVCIDRSEDQELHEILVQSSDAIPEFRIELRSNHECLLQERNCTISEPCTYDLFIRLHKSTETKLERIENRSWFFAIKHSNDAIAIFKELHAYVFPSLEPKVMDLNALFPMWTVDVILVVTESDAIENIESNLADYREFIQDAWLHWSWLTPINIRTQVKFAPRKTVESWLQVFDPLDLGHRGNTDFLDIAANRHDKASFHMLIYTQSQDLHDSDGSHHEVPTWGVVYNQHANDPRARRAFVSHAVQTFLTRTLYHAVPTPPSFISKGLQHHASSLRLTRRVLEHLLCRYAFNRTLATLSSTEALSRQIADLAVPRSFGRLVHDAHDSLAQLGRAMYDKDKDQDRDKDEDRDKDKDKDKDRDRDVEGPYPTCRALLLSTQALETHADFWETPNIPADNKYAVYVSMFVPVVLPLLKGLRQLHRQHSLLLLKLPPDPSPLPTTAAAPSTPLS